MVTSFCRTVSHVVSVCPSVQMQGRAALRTITMMKHPKPVRYRAEVDFPTQAVGIVRYAVNTKRAIASTNLSARPNPTRPKLRPVRRYRTIFSDSFPKPFNIFLGNLDDVHTSFPHAVQPGV